MPTKRDDKVPPSRTSGESKRIDDEEIAYYGGLFGCNPLEVAARLGHKLDSAKLLAEYQRGKSEHAFNIMRAIYIGAVVDKKDKLLLWLAENSLKRNEDAKTGNALIDALTHEQRQERIRKLTKEISLGNEGNTDRDIDSLCAKPA